MRPEKTTIVGEIDRQVAQSSFVFIADYQGLRVDQLSNLRAQLKGVGAEFHVVKNRLFKRIAGERNWEGLDSSLRGPSAMVVGTDVVEAAKVLRRFATENKEMPAVKAGVLGNAVITKSDFVHLAELPSRGTLLSMFMGTLVAPARGLVSVLNAKVGSIVSVLKAVQDKKSA